RPGMASAPPPPPRWLEDFLVIAWASPSLTSKRNAADRDVAGAGEAGSEQYVDGVVGYRAGDLERGPAAGGQVGADPVLRLSRPIRVDHPQVDSRVALAADLGAEPDPAAAQVVGQDALPQIGVPVRVRH